MPIAWRNWEIDPEQFSVESQSLSSQIKDKTMLPTDLLPKAQQIIDRLAAIDYKNMQIVGIAKPVIMQKMNK